MPNGERTLAKVLKFNGKSVKVETVEERGTGRSSQVGSKWTCAYACIFPADDVMEAEKIIAAEKNRLTNGNKSGTMVGAGERKAQGEGATTERQAQQQQGEWTMSKTAAKKPTATEIKEMLQEAKRLGIVIPKGTDVGQICFVIKDAKLIEDGLEEDADTNGLPEVPADAYTLEHIQALCKDKDKKGIMTACTTMGLGVGSPKDGYLLLKGLINPTADGLSKTIGMLRDKHYYLAALLCEVVLVNLMAGQAETTPDPTEPKAKKETAPPAVAELSKAQKSAIKAVKKLMQDAVDAGAKDGAATFKDINTDLKWGFRKVSEMLAYTTSLLVEGATGDTAWLKLNNQLATAGWGQLKMVDVPEAKADSKPKGAGKQQPKVEDPTTEEDDDDAEEDECAGSGDDECEDADEDECAGSGDDEDAPVVLGYTKKKVDTDVFYCLDGGKKLTELNPLLTSKVMKNTGFLFDSEDDNCWYVDSEGWKEAGDALRDAVANLVFKFHK